MHMSIAFALVFLSCSCSFAAPCSGPVTYNTTDFTIKGPCPNDVVITPVGDTVQYSCDYVNDKYYSPYWHIAGLEGSPFIIGETDTPVNNIMLVDVRTGTTGYTTIDIPVMQQYLNHTLVIQCGLCSGPVCFGIVNPLGENISSSTVRLVAFSTPSSLNQVILANTVLLSWSPPLISVDYADLVEFDYNVTLTRLMEGLQMVVFKTQNTYLNVSRYNITMNNLNPCNKYEWSVTAMVGDEQTKSVRGDRNFSLQTEPRINSGISVVILPCDDVISFVIGISVTTFQPLDTLNYSICLLNDAVVEFCFDEPEIKGMDSEFVNLTVFLANWTTESLIRDSSDTFDVLCDYSILVHVRNECGQSTSEEYKFNTNGTLNCTSYQTHSSTVLYDIPILYGGFLTSTTSIATSIAVTSSKQTVGSPAAEKSNENTIDITVISVSAAIFTIILCIICVLFILSLLIWLKRRRGKFGLVDKACGDSSNSAEVPASLVPTSDYQTPFEAVHAKENYKAGLTSLSPSQYSEPQVLKSQLLPLTPVVQSRCQPVDHTNEVHELPGYSEVHRPPNNVTRGSVKSTKRAETTNEANNQTYADVDEVKKKKSLKVTSYAELDIPPPTGPPPPVPGSTTIYTTIQKEADSNPPNLPLIDTNENSAMNQE